MKKILLTDKNGYASTYKLDEIDRILHGKAKDFYDKSDLDGNGIKVNDSIIYIMFKDNSTASFPSDWFVTFE